MRTFGKLVLACGLVGLLVAPAQAQRPGGGRGFGMGGPGGGLMLLTNKSVQQELKVDDTQAEKLNSFAQGMRDKQGEQFQKLQDLSQDERRAKMQELGQAMAAEVRKGLSDILKPEQVKRYDQIQLQQLGVLGAPAMPRVLEALNLTEDQRSKLRTINEEQAEARRELFQGGGGGGGFSPEAMQKMNELRKKGNDKAMALLTDAQKSTWNELTGAPFEVKFEPGQGPGGGRPGGRRNNNNN
jgi:hypothetical protein